MADLLAGKTALITGAGSGVGRASALRFAAEGANVVCADIRLEWAEATVDQITALGQSAIAAHCDVSQEADVIGAIATAVDRYGRLDVMFNNAGIPTPRLGALLEDHSVEDFDRLVSVNLRGPFLGCKHAVLQFKRQGTGGAIINTGSMAGLVGIGGTIYGSIKGGVHQLTRGVAIEGAPFGIRVNGIAPGAMPQTDSPPLVVETSRPMRSSAWSLMR